ncbi:coiled-coil protein [Melanogaster broomeanus]|nr:coiled-coil protein [Melanogaster broomeanus]
MASASDGLAVAALPHMPDFSINAFSSTSERKFHLQLLLDNKEKQLQQAGALGQRVLAQQIELEEKIRQLQDFDAERGDDEELDAEARERYRELADTIKAWNAENAQLSSAFGTSKRDEPERSKASASSAAQSRRAKNAAHRADDVEFAFEIGSGLLTEVRRLQSLLGERDKAIQDMKEEKDDLEKSIEALRAALRAQEQSSDKFKEENWNLEVTLQELRTQLSDSQSTSLRLEGEHKRLTKLLNTARESADQHKNETERIKTTLDEFKAKHDTEFAQARKHAAGLQRDKSDLQSALDTMKAEVAKANRKLGPKFGDFLTPVTVDDDDVFTRGGASTNKKRIDTSTVFQAETLEDLADVSPDPSPSRPFHASNHPNKEIEALQQRLFHAERQIKTLKGSLHREKEMRMDYKRKLEALPGRQAQTQTYAFRSGVTRARGRRGRGGFSLTDRLGMAAHSPSSDYNGASEFGLSLTPPPPVPSIPGSFQDLDGGDDDLDIGTSDNDGSEEQEQEVQQRAPDSPLAPPSNRASVDGMDPLFANVLRKSASYSSFQAGTSPLPPRRPRGGAAFQEARPPSLVGQPEALSAALAADVTEDDREMKEVECQTEMGDLMLTVPIVATSPAEAEGVPPATDEVVVSIRVSSSTSTDPEAVTQTSQAEAQTSPSSMRTQRPVFSPGPRRTTLMQSDFSPTRGQYGDDASGDSTIRNISASDDESDIDDGATETGAETETDADDYHDARMSIGMEDFHSSDEESIKASRISSRVGRSSMSSFKSREFYEQARTPVEYEEKGIDAAPEEVKVVEIIKEVEEVEVVREVVREVIVEKEVEKPVEVVKWVERPVEVEVIKYVEQPKPEVKEMCMQTDPPRPVTPPTTLPVTPVSTPGKALNISTSSATPTARPIFPPSPGAPLGLYRVGSTGQPFQFVAPASPPISPTSGASSPVVALREVAAPPLNIIPARSSQTDQRQSIESAISAVVDDPARQSRTLSTASSVVDKTRPPTMALPPPPRLPPPPNTMPPPSFIPERRFPTTSSGSSDIPPPRPSSPPPAELIHRATTPTFGSMLSVQNRRTGPRQHGSSMPPPTSNLRQPPSTSSFRSAANAAAHAQNSQPPSGLPSWTVREKERRELSSTSLTSDRSALSPRSSMSSEHNPFVNRAQSQGGLQSATPAQSVDQNGTSTDPTVIHAITQTMIGEFLYKYTRRTIGKGYGEKRHKRFFWVHPYTKTLYWSSADPGSSNVSESSAKSAYIEGVRAVLDPNPMPPGLYQYSVVISTAQREMKITAPTKERHDIWLNALKYLLARPNPAGNGEFTDDDHRQLVDSSPQSQRSGRSSHSGAFNTTPRGKRSRSQMGSIGKRSGTPAAEYLRWAAPESPYSPSRSFEQVLASNGQDDDELEFELHGGSQSDDGFEGLENVRACCDGRHTVGHHHHHPDHLEVNAQARPSSPAWSLRSRTGSAHSHRQRWLVLMGSWGRRQTSLWFKTIYEDYTTLLFYRKTILLPSSPSFLV